MMLSTRARALIRLELLAGGLIAVGVLHALQFPRLDTLSSALIAGGVITVTVGPPLLPALRRISGLKVAGIFELALHAVGEQQEPDQSDDAEDEPAGGGSPAALAEAVEKSLREAAKWVQMSDRPRSRSGLLAALTGRGYIGSFEAAAIEAFFADAPDARSPDELRALRQINSRLKIEILIRAAASRFEKRGIPVVRPGLPRVTVGYHLVALVPGSEVVYVTVVLARSKDSRIATDRARDMGAKIPGDPPRWLVAHQRITPQPSGVETVAVGDLQDRVDALVERN